MNFWEQGAWLCLQIHPSSRSVSEMFSRNLRLILFSAEFVDDGFGGAFAIGAAPPVRSIPSCP